MTSAERQKLYRTKMYQQGFVQVTGWVRTTQQSSVMDLLRRLQQNPDLEAGSPRNTVTGKLEKLTP